MEEAYHTGHCHVPVSLLISEQVSCSLAVDQNCSYFMFTYITTTTVPSFPDLQEQLGISYSQVNWTVAIPALGLAVGPLLWSSLADSESPSSSNPRHHLTIGIL